MFLITAFTENMILQICNVWHCTDLKCITNINELDRRQTRYFMVKMLRLQQHALQDNHLNAKYSNGGFLMCFV